MRSPALVSSLLVLLVAACATGGGDRDGGGPRLDAPGLDATAPADAGTDARASDGATDATTREDDAGRTDDAAGDLDAFSVDDAAIRDDARDDDAAADPDAFAPSDAYAVPDAYVIPDAFVPPDAAPPCVGQLDCTACAGGHCVLGACSMTNPASLTYDFEAGVPSGWTNGMGGTAPWTIDTAMPHGGARSLRSGAIGHGAQTRVGFSLTLASPASLSFWVRTSTETCCDEGELWVDGAMRAQRAGTTAWTLYAVDLAPGFHSLEFRYTKDGSVASGMDAVWIDDVTLGPPTDPSTDFEAAGLPAGYTTSGSASWTNVTTMPHGGSRCAQSGTIGASQTTTLARSVSLAADQTFSFWYRTSTESGFDDLEVWIDGAQRDAWSGTIAWTMASYPLTAGSHTIEWRYTKDGSVSSGSDAVWIDDVAFGPAPVGGPLCGP